MAAGAVAELVHRQGHLSQLRHLGRVVVFGDAREMPVPKRYIVTAGAWPEAKADCGPVRCPLIVYVAPSLKQGTAEPLVSVTWKATGTLVTSIASACAAPAGPARTKAKAIPARREGRRSVAVRVISDILPFGASPVGRRPLN